MISPREDVVICDMDETLGTSWGVLGGGYYEGVPEFLRRQKEKDRKLVVATFGLDELGTKLRSDHLADGGNGDLYTRLWTRNDFHRNFFSDDDGNIFPLEDNEFIDIDGSGSIKVLSTGKIAHRYKLRCDKDLNLLLAVLSQEFRTDVNAVIVGDDYEKTWVEKSGRNDIPVLEVNHDGFESSGLVDWATKGDVEIVVDKMFAVRARTFEVFDQLFASGSILSDKVRIVTIENRQLTFQIYHDGVRLVKFHTVK